MQTNSNQAADLFFEKAVNGGLTWIVNATSASIPYYAQLLADLSTALDSVAIIGNNGMLAGNIFPAEKSRVEAISVTLAREWVFLATAVSPVAAHLVLNIVDNLVSQGLSSATVTFMVSSTREQIPHELIRTWYFPVEPNVTDFQLMNEMLDPPSNYLVLRFNFREKIDEATISLLEANAKAWEGVVNLGGFSDITATEPISCKVTHSELYLVMPRMIEYSLVGIFDTSDPFLLWISAASRLTKGSNPLLSLELE